MCPSGYRVTLQGRSEAQDPRSEFDTVTVVAIAALALSATLTTVGH